MRLVPEQGHILSNESIKHDTSPLSQLIAFDSDDRAIWPAVQLRAILRQQLLAPFPAAVLPVSMDSGEGDAAEPRLESFQDLLNHPRPPVDLLCQTKEFAKRAKDDAASHMPPEIALLLYYGSISIALVRRGQRITTLCDDDLRQGLNWAIREPWVDQALKAIFLEALRFLRSGRDKWRR